jgi:hypothetical protein
VVFAGHPRAWSLGILTFTTGARPKLLKRLKNQLSLFYFISREGTDGKCFGTAQAFACASASGCRANWPRSIRLIHENTPEPKKKRNPEIKPVFSAKGK